MIIARTNCQIRPTVNAITLLVNACWPVGAPAANAGATTQPRMAIGMAASAQRPRILPSEYCSLISAAAVVRKETSMLFPLYVSRKLVIYGVRKSDQYPITIFVCSIVVLLEMVIEMSLFWMIC